MGMFKMVTNRHGGNIRQLSKSTGLPIREILDFSANISPLGPPEWFRSFSSQISSIVHYPDPDCSAMVEAISARYGVALEEVLVEVWVSSPYPPH